MAPFLDNLHRFERAVLSQRNSNSLINIRHLIQVELTDDSESGTVMLRPASSSEILPGDKRGWNRVASLVLAYKLADVIGLLNDVQPHKVQTKRLRVGKEKFPSLSKLKDWTSLLSTFKSCASREKPRPTSAFETSNNIHVKLFKWLCFLNDSKIVTKMKFNLVAAVIHIAFLRNHRFADEEVPELTGELKVFAAQFLEPEHLGVEVSLDSRELDLARMILPVESDASDEQNLMSGNSLRNPLHFALVISPLYLLTPLQLLKSRVGRRNLLSTFICLGNDKPPALIQVEKAIWNVVFQLAAGSMDPDVATATLCTSLPWDEIEACSTEHRGWFVLDHDLKNLDVSESLVQPSTRSEGDEEAETRGTLSETDSDEDQNMEGDKGAETESNSPRFTTKSTGKSIGKRKHRQSLLSLRKKRKEDDSESLLNPPSQGSSFHDSIQVDDALSGEFTLEIEYTSQKDELSVQDDLDHKQQVLSHFVRLIRPSSLPQSMVTSDSVDSGAQKNEAAPWSRTTMETETTEAVLFPLLIHLAAAKDDLESLNFCLKTSVRRR